MPSIIALILCTLYVLFLFYRDHRRQPQPSAALWIPLTWMFIIGSRFPSEWLGLRGSREYSVVSMEGSPLDRAIFSILIILGLFILYRKKVHLRSLILENKWAAAFLIFALLSILWSDYSMVSLKRWIKSAGNLVMVLVILTDPHPRVAFSTALRRCSYIVIPFSILLIKWYPHLGRSYLAFSWTPTFTGITTNKNGLGSLCVLAGIYFFWELFEHRKSGREGASVMGHILNTLSLLFMVIWLLNKAQSSTSTLCFLLGMIIITAFNMNIIQKKARHMEMLVVTFVVIFIFLQVVVGVGEAIVESLGRDMTFTGRTELWTLVLALVKNPLLGTGWESFFLGDRYEILGQIYYWRPNQAHNGYIETYLQLGVVGLLLLGGFIASGFRKIKTRLMEDGHIGSIYLAFFLYALLSNITEATFKGINLIFFLFYLVSIRVPDSRSLSE